MTRWVSAVLAIALTLGAVAWSLGIAQILSLPLYTEQFAAGMLALTLALAYLHMPARRSDEPRRVPWYDALAALAGAAAAGYIAVQYNSLVDLILVKLLRIRQIIANKGRTEVSEGADANFMDIINYAVFALIKSGY